MDFIYTRHNVVTHDYCKKVISHLEKSDFDEHLSNVDRKDSSGEAIKKSSDIAIDLYLDTSLEENHMWWPINNLRNVLYNNIISYIDRFHIALDANSIESSRFCNYQHYKPSEGYFSYHHENNGKPHNNRRVLTWMLYLNTIKYGGETEFLYQRHFEKAEAAKLVIWPAGFTHTHRGISSNENKHIFTGWFEYKLPEDPVKAVTPKKVS